MIKDCTKCGSPQGIPHGRRLLKALAEVKMMRKAIRESDRRLLKLIKEIDNLKTTVLSLCSGISNKGG